MSYQTTVLADEPALYWRLGEAAGSGSAADASGHERTGTASAGVTLGQPGVLRADANTAAHWNGTDGVVVQDAPAGYADTFTRADDGAGWGTASDGHTWTAHPQESYGNTDLVSAQGRLGSDSDFNTTLMVLGPPLATDDAEMLVRWTIQPGTLADDGVILVLRCDASNTLNFDRAILNINLSGSIQVGVQVGGTGEYVYTFTWAGGAVGSAFWTRFRAVGQTYSFRTWPDDGSPEPGTWDGTHTATLVTTQRSVGLWAALDTGDLALFDSVSAGPYPTGALPTLPAAASIEVWLRTTTTQGGVLAQFATADGTQRDLTLYLRADGVPAFRAGDTEIVRSSERTVADGRIHHLVATLDADAAAWLYVDGSQAAHHAGVVPGSSFAGRWQIGAGMTLDLAVPPLSAAYAGTIDEVCIYVD